MISEKLEKDKIFLKVGETTWDVDTNTRTGIPNHIYQLIIAMENLGYGNNLYLYHWTKNTNPIYQGANEKIVKRLPAKLSFFTNLPYEMNREDLDILHIQMPTLNQIVPSMFQSAKAKRITTVYDITTALFPEMHTKNTAFSFNTALKISKLFTNHYIAISECTKNDLVKYYNIPKDKISVVYPGKNDKFKIAEDKTQVFREITKKLDLQLEEPYILSVGTLEPRKNIINLIKAYSFLKKAGIKNKLIIVGMKGWKFSPIFDLVQELSLNNDVIFPGYVTDEDLVSLYQAAEVFVYPSFYEGFGLPPLEAMACGIPVIVSNNSSLPEVVGDAGTLIDPAKPEEIANAIEEILCSESKQNELRNAGINRSSKFSWEKTAEETWKIYEKIAKKQ